MTTGTWVRLAAERLAGAGVDSPLLDAQVLAAFAHQESRSWVLSHPEAPMPEQGDELLARRLSREPLAYITGRREFYGREFFVSANVLVPRQETETVVELALEQTAEQVLDLCTGSGCIGITLKLEKPHWRVTASDLSPEALTVALRNSDALGADIELVVGDLLAPFANRRFDLIVSNPPYIADDAVLQPEIAQFEPELALRAGRDGLDLYRRIAVESKSVLPKSGKIVLEIGAGQAEDISDLFEAQGFKNRASRDDLSNVPRALCFELGST